MENKTIFISGGTGIVGRQLIIDLIKNPNVPYNTIVFTYFNNIIKAQKLMDLSTINIEIVGIKIDFTNKQNTVYEMEKITELFNIVALVNCFGVTHDKLFINMEIEEFEKLIFLNTIIPTVIIKKVLPGMISRKEGHIINFSSIAGKYGNIGQTNYAASKAALDGFIKSLAKEIGIFSICVNNIAPGMIQSEMVESMPSHRVNDLLKRTSTREFVQVEDISSFAQYLLLNNHSMTGETIEISGQLVL